MPEIDPDQSIDRADLELQKQAHHAAMGRVVDEWAFFEWQIDECSIELACVELNVGACFTSQVAGHGRKLDAYISLARLRNGSGDLLKALNSFAKDVAGVAERRHRVIHDPWFAVTPAHEARRFEVTARKVLRAEIVSMPTEKVVELADHIRAKAEEFHQLHQRLIGENVLQMAADDGA